MGLFKRTKNTNKPVFRQILDLIPDWILQRNINKFNSDKGCHNPKFSYRIAESNNKFQIMFLQNIIAIFKSGLIPTKSNSSIFQISN